MQNLAPQELTFFRCLVTGHSHEEQTQAGAFEKMAPNHPGYNSTNLASAPGHQGSSCSIRQLEAVGCFSPTLGLASLLCKWGARQCSVHRVARKRFSLFSYRLAGLELRLFLTQSLLIAAVTRMSQNAQASIKILFIYIYVFLVFFETGSHSTPDWVGTGCIAQVIPNL